MLLGGVHKLKGSELVTLSLETLDDFTNETALDAYYMKEGQYGGALMSFRMRARVKEE